MKPPMFVCALLLLTSGLIFRTPLAKPFVPITPTTEALAIGREMGDAYAVRASAALPLENMKPDESWVLAKVNADAESPTFALDGGYFDQTGKFVANPGERAHDVSIEWGTMETVAVLSGATAAPLGYHFKYGSGLVAGSSFPYDEDGKYWPFGGARGVTCVFRINQGAEDKARFGPVYLVRDEWVNFVSPALQYVRANRAMFEAEAVKQHRAQLQQLLLNANPLIGIAAARALSKAEQLEVGEAFAHCQGARLSAFVFLALKQLPGDKPLHLTLPIGMIHSSLIGPLMEEAETQAIVGEVPLNELGRFIDGVKDAETLEAVTIGIIAYLYSPQRYRLARARSDRLLRRIINRQKTLGTHTKSDAYLNRLPALVRMRDAMAK